MVHHIRPMVRMRSDDCTYSLCSCVTLSMFSEILRCSRLISSTSCRDGKAMGMSRIDSRLTVIGLAVLCWNRWLSRGPVRGAP